MLNFNDFLIKTSPNVVKLSENKDEVKEKPQEENNKQQTETVLVANPSQMVISKNKLASTLAVVGLISGTVMFAVGRAKKFSAQDASKVFEGAQDALSDANKKIRDLEGTIKELSDRLKERAILTKETSEIIETKTKNYREMIDGLTSIYEDAVPPENYKINSVWGSSYKIPFSEYTIDEILRKKHEFVDDLLAKFKALGKVEKPLNHKSASLEEIQAARIKEQFFGEIGIPQRTNMLKNYGESANWSDEKIARDILQNFFDGNNHSLDDVGLLVEKLPNGKFRVKISGNGVFDHEKLMFLGATTKAKNPYDAGGFGEGVKVVSACMLNKGHAENIRFGSANWELVFDEKDGIIRTTLNKLNNDLNGNFVEFETPNEGFAQNVIKAMDYFNHSKNPDFSGLTFENDEFGFRILPIGQKGNFYMTQRFEFGDQGAWEEGVEGLDIIFKRSPDGFKIDRDRTNMDCNDVYNFTKYFAKNMKNDEILSTLLKTQKYWFTFKSSENKAIKSFANALIDEASKRNIGIDFSNEKICCADYRINDVVRGFLQRSGYKIIEDESCNFHGIGMPTSGDVFKFLSNHKALEVTPKEAKKMKILEEATKSIQEGFEEAYIKDLLQIFSKLTKEDFKADIEGMGLLAHRLLYRLEDFKVDENVARKMFGSFIIYDEEKFNEAVQTYLQEKVTTINLANFDENSQNVIKLIQHIIEYNSEENERLAQIAEQIKKIDVPIIKKNNVIAPRFVFDSTVEPNSAVLGEAITEYGKYKGHWIDRHYLNNGNFYNLLSTWIHEICHQYGGDGTPEFTYKLTDVLESILKLSADSPKLQTDLLALEKVFNEI